MPAVTNQDVRLPIGLAATVVLPVHIGPVDDEKFGDPDEQFDDYKYLIQEGTVDNDGFINSLSGSPLFETDTSGSIDILELGDTTASFDDPTPELDDAVVRVVVPGDATDELNPGESYVHALTGVGDPDEFALMIGQVDTTKIPQ